MNMCVICMEITGQVDNIFTGMVSYEYSLRRRGKRQLGNGLIHQPSVYALRGVWTLFWVRLSSPSPPPHPRLCAVMEQETTSTYLNNSKTKREATNNV